MPRTTLVEIIHRIYESPTTELAKAVEKFGLVVAANPKWDFRTYDPAVTEIGRHLPPPSSRKNPFTADHVVRCCFIAGENSWERCSKAQALVLASLMFDRELDEWCRRVTAFNSIADLESSMSRDGYVPTFVRCHSLGSALGLYLETQGFEVKWIEG